LSERTPAEQTIDGETSFVTARKTVNFFTGVSQRVDQSEFDRWAQRFADGLRLGMIIAICSVGLSLIFGTTGLTNFAHGELVTFGALVAWWLNRHGLHVIFATVLAVIAGGLLGFALDKWGFAKLRKRGVGLIPQMIITIGMSVFAKNLYLSRFGGSPAPYLDYTNQVGKQIGPVTITIRDLVTMIISVIVVAGIALTLQYTQLGKATRAVSDNRDLASATGINTTRIVRIIWAAGAALAALGGVFRGLDESVDYNMGGGLLFLMFAAITLGGLGSAYGALLGGLIVGVMVEMATLFGVPTELKAVPALLMLVLILLVRPQGILGRSQRVG
jgi:branched-chain amino acid transport system permease protein